MLVCRITFTTYAQHRKIGKSNTGNLKDNFDTKNGKKIMKTGLIYGYSTYERMWWRLFYIRAYVVKVILHTSVCGEGYSTYERMWWRLFYIRAYVLKVILHTSVCGEGYSTYERMWWRLFYIRAYVVKVILHTSVCGEGYSTYERMWWRLFYIRPYVVKVSPMSVGGEPN
jgi:hypothetical protein